MANIMNSCFTKGSCSRYDIGLLQLTVILLH